MTDKHVNIADASQVEIWNAAIERAASTARTWGPPPCSWSESSIIIKDTCDEISRAICELKK